MNKTTTHYEELKKQALAGGGATRIARQHQKGKQTARERIQELLDPGTFSEIGLFGGITPDADGNGKSSTVGDGVVTGQGKINGRRVYVFAQDFTVKGGSVGKIHGRKITRIQDLALQNGSPLIGLNDSGGARIQEGVNSLAAYGDIFQRNIKMSGVVPQISVILGPCAGGAVYSPAMTDFVFMVNKTSQMFITGPDVIREVTHEEVDFESLGGADVHHATSGVAHFSHNSESEALQHVRWLLSFLPSNNLTQPPRTSGDDSPQRKTPEIQQALPQSPKTPYDISKVILSLVDQGEFIEIQENHARNIVTGFGRLNGHSVGVVANQPDHLAGVIDLDASDKAARFIRFCDAFHIPILTLVDTPGFMPGVDQEHRGIIRHGAKLIYAYGEATVPKITLILRKSYGGAYIVMGSKHLAADCNLAFPNSEIAVMGPDGAVKILHKQELNHADNPVELKQNLAEQYRRQVANPYLAASEGYLDDIISPADSRTRIISALESLLNKRLRTPDRKHGNIPL